MFRIDLAHLCWAIENLVAGKVVNQIKVDAHTRRWAMVALERMLAIKATPQTPGRIAATPTTID
jgi:quinolinate synthase